MVIKLVPLESKQTSQIWILQELTISLVAFLVPGGYLAGLIMLAKLTSSEEDFVKVIPYCNTRKTSTCCTVAEKLPSFHIRDMFSYR